MTPQELKDMQARAFPAAAAPTTSTAAPAATAVPASAHVSTTAPVVTKTWAPLGSGWAPETPATGKAVPPAVDTRRVLSVLCNLGIPASELAGKPVTGPSTTLYPVRLEEGARVSTVGKKGGDIAFGLGLPAVRVLDYLPGYPGCIGLEIANAARGTVLFPSVLAAAGPAPEDGHVRVALGADTDGRPYMLHLDASNPHLLIAGKSGSGKSVAVHTVIASVAALYTPAEVQLAIVDPKIVDFQCWSGLPHLMCDPVHDSQAISALVAGIAEDMEDRYARMRTRGCSSVGAYNDNVGARDHMPRVIVVVDEFSDMMSKPGRNQSDITLNLLALARKGRAAGIHLVLATQRPTADAMHPDLKAQATRLACKVGSATDSRIILDTSGAEDLQDRGDALITDSSGLSRIQIAWASPAVIAALKTGKTTLK